jgi:hypothetical protein
VNGGHTSYAYDPAIGVLSTVTDVLGNGFSYAYDAEGRIDTLTNITGSAQKILDVRRYDADGELVRRIVSGSGSGANNLRNDTLTYDMRGKALSNGVDVVSYAPLGAVSSSTLGGLYEGSTPDANNNVHALGATPSTPITRSRLRLGECTSRRPSSRAGATPPSIITTC